MTDIPEDYTHAELWGKYKYYREQSEMRGKTLTELRDKLEALRNAMPPEILHTDYRRYANSIEKLRRILGED